MNHDPGFHLSCDEHLSKGWGPPLNDGSVIWKNLNDMAGYSSAVIHRVGDITAAVFFTEERAVGVDVSDGRLLWSYDRVANFTANVATPIVRANRLFVSSDYGRGGALLEITPTADGLRSDEVYFNRNMRNHHSSSVLVGEYLYGFSGSTLTAVRFDDGRVAWQHRSVGKGSLVYADERLYLMSERGSSDWRRRRRMGIASRVGLGSRQDPPRLGRTPSWPVAGCICAIRMPSTPTTSESNRAISSPRSSIAHACV